jgi:hypothetical protein
MIPITKEILGPGIEEEYADALPRINELLEILKPFPAGNRTPEGRLKYELEWLKREIENERLSFPVDRRHIESLFPAILEGLLDKFEGARGIARELYMVLSYGLIKTRHYPVVAAMIDDTMARISPSASTPDVQAALDDLQKIKTGLLDGSITLPLGKEDFPAFTQMRWSRRPNIPIPIVEAMFAIGWTLCSGGRPSLCDKGKLPAPCPGLREDLARPRRWFQLWKRGKKRV